MKKIQTQSVYDIPHRRAYADLMLTVSKLEKVIDRQNAVIQKYQKHYQKYGHFYKDFEKKRARLSRLLRRLEAIHK